MDMHRVKRCPIRQSLHCLWVLVHLNVISLLNHMIVSDVASHSPVSSAELLCTQAVSALKCNSPATILRSI